MQSGCEHFQIEDIEKRLDFILMVCSGVPLLDMTRMGVRVELAIAGAKTM
jgi:hypothetical protein